MSDPFDLERFVSAQAPVWEQALAELRAGAKRSHWMWFVFPQLRGLGRSAMAERYGIGGRAEAAAYRAHPVLGTRLVLGTEAVLGVSGRSAEAIFGGVDAAKFRSSMTLFAAVAEAGDPFGAALGRYFGGAADPRTRSLLEGA